MDELVATKARIETAWQEAQGRLDRVIESLDHLECGVVLYGPDDRIVFCNQRFRDIYTEVAALLRPGMPYADVARAYYRRGFEARRGMTEEEYVRWRCDKHLDPDEGDYEYQHGEDTWLWVSDRKTADGGVIGFRVDITARKNAEQALAASESRFRSLLEMSSDWYWEQDRQLRFTRMARGPHASQITDEEVVGKTRWELPWIGVTDEQWDAHRAVLAAHQPFRHFEYRRHVASGAERWVSVSGEPVFDTAGAFAGYRGVGADITERKRYEQTIKELAEYDFLTGLPNRNLLASRFAFAQRSATRTGAAMALVFIDLDRFKTVNDSLGHTTGDKLLKLIASRLTHLVRGTDTVCRHGGDEFLILLPDVGDPAHAARIAAQVGVELSRPYDVDGYELLVTPSIGISMYPADGIELPLLIRNADAAMYHSKSMGRNRFSFFNEGMNARISERLMLENGLKRALARSEFYLEYQPVFALPGQRMAGAEALIRWRHPEHGVVPPARFIPIAEETGLILDIGEWVIREACSQMWSWRRAGLVDLPLRVNLSGLQFRQKNLLDILTHALADNGLTPADLELEVTESVLLTEVEMASGLIEALSARGFRLAIDDFGTGYSSLAYLHRLPIDKVKIDKSFVRDLATHASEAALARGIIGLAKSLNIGVVAEGVESQAQLDFVRDNGCDEAQGYFLGKPVPAGRFAEIAGAAA
jgi:diguanylate cyclase (GGDEF)-like protein/PAS domain S-box-containing protein